MVNPILEISCGSSHLRQLGAQGSRGCQLEEHLFERDWSHFAAALITANDDSLQPGLCEAWAESFVRPEPCPIGKHSKSSRRCQKRGYVTVALATGAWVCLLADMCKHVWSSDVAACLPRKRLTESFICSHLCIGISLIEVSDGVGSCTSVRQQAAASEESSRRTKLPSVCCGSSLFQYCIFARWAVRSSA